MDALVILSWIVGLGAMLLKWAVVSEFHREKSPDASLVQIHWKMNMMTWEQRYEYHCQFGEFLRRSGRLWYNRILNLTMILGMAGFIAFGYLADAQLPKHKKQQPAGFAVQFKIG